MRRIVLVTFICMTMILMLVSCGSEESDNKCYAEDCKKEGTIIFEGLSGEIEYYCEEHFQEMNNMIDSMFGEGNDVYKYSDYIAAEHLKEELLTWFEEYNICYYDESVVEEYDGMDLPMPETAIVDFPSNEFEDDAYVYRFDAEEELKVYTAAYMVYLMNFDFEVNELDGNVYSINDKYYMGLGMDSGDYILMILEL